MTSRVLSAVIVFVALAAAPGLVCAQRGGHGGGGFNGGHIAYGGFRGGAFNGWRGGFGGYPRYGYGWGFGFGVGFGVGLGWGPYWGGYPYAWGYPPHYYYPPYSYPYYGPPGYLPANLYPPTGDRGSSPDSQPAKLSIPPEQRSIPDTSSKTNMMLVSAQSVHRSRMEPAANGASGYPASDSGLREPPPRREVQNVINALRAMPPDARQRQINSGRYRNFSPEERELLNHVSQLP